MIPVGDAPGCRPFSADLATTPCVFLQNSLAEPATMAPQATGQARSTAALPLAATMTPLGGHDDRLIKQAKRITGREATEPQERTGL